MSSLELGFTVFVGAVVLFGSAVSLYVLLAAYFGGRDRTASSARRRDLP